MLLLLLLELWWPYIVFLSKDEAMADPPTKILEIALYLEAQSDVADLDDAVIVRRNGAAE